MASIEGRRGALPLIGGVLAVVIFLGVVWSTYYTVEQGEVGVLIRNGALVGENGPGLHFKLPLIDTVEHISIQPQLDSFDGLENGYPALSAYSQDQQPATIKLTVNYHVTSGSAVYAQYGNLAGIEHRLIDPRVVEEVKNIFGTYSATSVIQDRARFNAQIDRAIRKAVHGPVVIDGVQVVDIAFSQQYENAVEARMQAIIAQEQAIAEKQRRITNADAAAYEVKAQADAQAHQIEVEGAAQAQAIRARADALKENPELVQLTAAEKWNGQLPTTMLPGGSVPFVNLPGR